MQSEKASSDPADFSAVSFDLSDWTQIVMRGTEARQFLHNFCTNDIHSLQSGQTAEAFVCDLKGRILAHILVLADEDGLHLISVPESAQVLLAHFNKYLLGAEVEIVDRSAEEGLLCLSGPEITSILTDALGQPVDASLKRCQSVATDGGSLLLAGTEMVLPPAILVAGERAAVAALRERIPSNLMALGTSEFFEILRIEAGFPWYGRDLNAELIAQSAARTSQAISFTKGCYLGQEPIARLDAMGHTNRELRGLFVPDHLVEVGDQVLLSDQPQGAISSAAFSQTRNGSVALAMLRTSAAAPGTELMIQTSHGLVPGKVFWPHLDACDAQSQ